MDSRTKTVNIVLPKSGRKLLVRYVDPEVIKKVTNVKTIYFAGYNDGMTEELTLKTNEILGKNADFLEGTYTVPFSTIEIPDAGDFSGYTFLTAGWNLLVDVGLFLGIDIDNAQRARKVGNEFT